MRRKPKRSSLKPQRYCLFCGGPKLSKTHIWPSWLNELLAPGDSRLIELENERWEAKTVKDLKQGSLFSQKPKLCCIDCNNGWMNEFENKMVKFAKPLFLDRHLEMDLTKADHLTIASWSALITVLAEYIDRSDDICISKDDVQHIYDNKSPPDDTWTIAAASTQASVWKAKYKHFSLFIGDFSTLEEYLAANASGRKSNTKIATFGMGDLLIQTFVCPNLNLVSDYRAFIARSGINQIWPIPPVRLWPFSKGTAKFPTQSIFNDEEAEAFACAFNQRIKILTGPDAMRRRFS